MLKKVAEAGTVCYNSLSVWRIGRFREGVKEWVGAHSFKFVSSSRLGGYLLKASHICDTVAKVLQPFLQDHELELVDIEYKKEGRKWFLRVFIDKPGGVQISDCEVVSEFLSLRLDALDLIPHHYILEVSSPGVERPLKRPQDFVRFKGSRVFVKTFAPVEGQKQFEGTLVDFIDNQVVLETDTGKINLPYDLVAQARLKVFS